MKTRIILHNVVLLCKKIEIIIVDNIEYKLSDVVPKDRQLFYKFIKTNVDKITYIKYYQYSGDTHFEAYYKKSLYHNLKDYAKFYPDNEIIEYFINGVKLKKDDWGKHPDRIKYLRKEKLKRILNE